MSKNDNKVGNPFIDMFENFGNSLPMPSVDVEKLMEHHRKNLEALQKSTQSFSSGATELMQKQREILEDGLQEISQIADKYRSGGGMQDAMNQQMDFARKSFEKALKDTGELAEIVKKSGGESVDVWRQRVEDIVADVREAFEKQTGGKG